MPESIRPIDQSRACRIALGTLKGNDSLISEALDEAYADDRFLAVLAATTRSWMFTSLHYAGEESDAGGLAGRHFRGTRLRTTTASPDSG